MTENRKFYIFGTGGHAKIAHALCQALGWQVAAFFDSNPAKAGTTCCGLPVLAQDNAADFLAKPGAAAHIAIGHNAIRQKIAGLYGALCDWPALIHPASYVEGQRQNRARLPHWHWRGHSAGCCDWCAYHHQYRRDHRA